MKTKLIKTVIVYLLWNAIIFNALAFFEASYDIFTWEPVNRGNFSFGGMIVGIPICLMVYGYKE